MTLTDIIMLDGMTVTTEQVASTETVKTIKEHLLAAQAKNVAWPKIVLAGYKFYPAPFTGKNAGAVYVKEKATGTYIGKVLDNKFYPIYGLHPEASKTIDSILNDLGAAIKVQGRKTGMCCICGRTLFNGNSIAAMIGPICAEKYGF
jgi:hypothetical protein